MVKKSNCFLSNFKTIKHEFEVLRELSHPNILKVFGFITDGQKLPSSFKGEKVCYLEMEYAQYEDIFEWIAEIGNFTEETCRFYFRSLIFALEYLHSAGLCHRDLKPQNLLIDANFNLKLADFGFATSLSGENGDGRLKGVLGTRGYMAPEIASNLPYFGVSVDIFAAGVNLFIMKAGHPPFSSTELKDPFFLLLCQSNYNKFWQLHSRGKTDDFFSDEFKNLINFMLHPDPVKRPSIGEIKAHPWFLGECKGVEGVKRELGGKRSDLLKECFAFSFEENNCVKKVLNRSNTD